MNSAQAMPTVAGTEHDSDGRIVSICYNSTPPLSVPATNLWLVAVDGSDNALRAVNHAARQVAAMSSSAVCLIHAQPWLSKEAAESVLAHRGLSATARARTILDVAGLPWRLYVTLGDPAECIIDQATRLNANSIVIGSRGLNALESLVFGSVAYKVVHRSPVPVIVVP